MKIIFDSEHQKHTFMRVVSGKSGCPSLYGLKNVDEYTCGCIGACKKCWDNAIHTAVIPPEEMEVSECMSSMYEKFMEVQ